MFGLIPRRREKTARALFPRSESPFRLIGKEFGSLWDEFGSLVDRFFDGWPMPLMGLGEVPRTWGIDTEEREKEVVVRVELPGFELADLDVRVRDELLTIEAKHEETKGKEEGRYAHVKRSITLPKGTEADKIEARYLNGILEVHVPKIPEVEGRRIEVKT